MDLPGNGARPSLKCIAAKLFFVAAAALKELWTNWENGFLLRRNLLVKYLNESFWMNLNYPRVSKEMESDPIWLPWKRRSCRFWPICLHPATEWQPPTNELERRDGGQLCAIELRVAMVTWGSLCKKVDDGVSHKVGGIKVKFKNKRSLATDWQLFQFGDAALRRFRPDSICAELRQWAAVALNGQQPNFHPRVIFGTDWSNLNQNPIDFHRNGHYVRADYLNICGVLWPVLIVSL